MGQAKNIFNGFFNLVKGEFDLLSPELKSLAKARSTICSTCPANINNSCSKEVTLTDLITKKPVTGCGCYLPAKVLVTDETCPANKW